MEYSIKARSFLCNRVCCRQYGTRILAGFIRKIHKLAVYIKLIPPFSFFLSEEGTKQEEKKMNPWIIFLFGVLIGWLIEWIIDWIYWRRKADANGAPADSAELNAARQEIAKLNAELEKCNEEEPDNLEKIKGIGPVIRRKLNEHGVFTFAELAELTAERLEEIVGQEIRRLANEEDLLRQAKEFAKKD
jgi:predicted flap endonuclease-1-like 5' DNA nuclease